MAVHLPPCPETLRAVQPYLKVASEHDERDPIVSYWCRLYSLQTALTIDKKSDEAKGLLLALMDWLENTKRAAKMNESISSEVAAQAYIENYALKVFVWADSMDRSGTFNKNVVKSFYTSGLLMDVLTVFGEQNEDILNNKKYAKWKAAYINNCLKNGETPVSGPVYSGNEENELNDLMGASNRPSVSASGSTPTNDSSRPFNPDHSSGPPASPSVPSQLPIQPDNNILYNPHPTPASESPQAVNDVSKTGNFKLDSTQIAKAQKFCKFASSALNYDDIPEAITNLQKALKLLQTGHDN